MKQKLFLLILILNVNLIFGQCVRVFDGLIDKYPIQVLLHYDSVNVSGYYFYKKYGIPIEISGKFENGQLRIREFSPVKGKWAYTTIGEFILDNSFNGIWKSENKEFKVTIKENKSQIKWELFEQKVELTLSFNKSSKHSFPIHIYIYIPQNDVNSDLLDLILSEILGVQKELYSTSWNYFNKYVLKNYSDYLNIYSDYLNNYLSDNYLLRYEVNMFGKIVTISDSILNYQTSGYVYEGGAHGYGFTYYYIFDLKRMKRLTFEDIFKSDVKPDIARLLYEEDNKEHKLEDFERNLGNIYMTNKGIGFFFNPYELDCYACGTFNYFLDFSKLQGLLKN